MTKDVKYVIFRIEEQKVVVVDKVGELGATHEQFVHDMPPNVPRFAVYDYDYVNDDGLVLKKILFVHWCPDNSRVADKMVFASTKENLKRRFVGLSGREIQASGAGDLTLEEFRLASR